MKSDLKILNPCTSLPLNYLNIFKIIFQKLEGNSEVGEIYDKLKIKK